MVQIDSGFLIKEGINIPENPKTLLINTLSLDASNQEVTSNHLKNFSKLAPAIEGIKNKFNLQEITIIVSSDNAKFLEELSLSNTFDLKIIENKDIFQTFVDNSDLKTSSIIVNLSNLENLLSEEITFSIKGPIKNPGIYTSSKETALLELVYQFGGGLKNHRNNFKALLWGGSFGVLLSQKDLNSSVNESLASLKNNYITNNFMVFDDTSCVVNLINILTLYNYQKLSSCSKCHFCQSELKEASDILESIVLGNGSSSDIKRLKILAQEKSEEALCSLGKHALLPLCTALDNFMDEFTEHVNQKYCRASVCENMFLSPCTNACPAGVDLPGTIGLMQKGLFSDAVALGREKNPFFLSCGRICEEPPCQKYCQRQTIDTSVNSRALHRFAGEIATTKSESLETMLNHPSLSTQAPTGKKIAVIGAGPAGLTAAYFLTRYGHKVTIFEKLNVPGGMMRVGIPDYRLPPDILNGEINHILSLGVEIKYNTKLGEDINLEELKNTYDAVYLAIGAHTSNNMGIKGEEIPGVMSGIDFLQKVNLNEKIIPGKKVIVVGGGNVAIDAARCALRLGANDVKIVYRRTMDAMPAAKEEIEAAQAEGIEIMPMLNPVEITGDKDLKEVRLEKMQAGNFDNSGRRKPQKTNEFITLQANSIIMAIGQSPDITGLDNYGIEINWSKLKVNAQTFETSVKGIFAGGDCVLGPATAVEAVAHGQKAADAIHKYLLPQAKVGFPSLRNLLNNYIGPYSCQTKEQQEPQKLEVSERITSFIEVEKPYTLEQADQEMERCICSAKTGL